MAKAEANQAQSEAERESPPKTAARFRDHIKEKPEPSSDPGSNPGQNGAKRERQETESASAPKDIVAEMKGDGATDQSRQEIEDANPVGAGVVIHYRPRSQK
jgi:hypothetical protein